MFRSTTTLSSSSSPSCYPLLPSLNPACLDSTSPAPAARPDLSGAMKFLLFALATSHSSVASKSFRIRTSAKCAHNSFRIRTYKTQDLKPFRMNTYEKTGGGVARPLSQDPISPCCFRSFVFFSYSYALFCTVQNAIPGLFNALRTLCTNHPGWGGMFRERAFRCAPLTTHYSLFTFSQSETNLAPQAAYPRWRPVRGIAAAAARALLLWNLSKC